MTQSRPDDPGPRRAAPVQGGPDRYEALLEVLEQQADRATHDRPVRRRDHPYSLVLLGVLILITAWLWILPPAWLIPPGPTPPPVAEEEAALRFAMYIQAQRIRAYELEHGRLPESLAEAGEALPGMRYAVLNDRLYELTGETERVELTYRSNQPLREWVGTGAEILEDVQQP